MNMDGAKRVRAIVFSGGRGSGALVRLLAANPSVDLTVAINGYDITEGERALAARPT